MKKILSITITLLCAVMLFSFSASAAEKVIAKGNCGDNGSNVTWKLYDTDSNGTADKLVISGSGAMDDFGTVDGYTLPPWYDYRAEIEKVVINKGVISIGRGSFYECKYLESVTIPSGVTSIGYCAFGYCEYLENVTIPSTVKLIDDFAFFDCESLETIKIPSGVTEIGASTFSGCASLETVSIPLTVTKIGEYAFYGCKYLKTITVPSKVTSIGNSAFYECSSLETIKIPSGVTAIEDFTFSFCKNLKSVSIPSGVKSIGDYAFAECRGIETIKIPSTVTKIGDYGFGWCNSLETVFLPLGMKTIEEGTFHWCENLKSVTIPSSVTSIREGAFNYCLALENVFYTGTKTAWGKVNIFDGNEPLTNAKIHCNTKKLTAPAVTASNVASSGKIRLSWNAQTGAKEYKVYRATSKTGTYKLLKTTTSTSFTNTSVEVGKTYYYKVRAIHHDANFTSDYSAIVSRTVDLPAPTMTLSINTTSGKPVIKWNAVDGAVSYKVAYCTTKDGTYKLLKDTTGTSVTHTGAKAGTKYYYQVRAIHSNSAANGAYCTAKYTTCDLPKPVMTLSKTSAGKPVISWEKVDGATSYKVAYCTTKDGTYKLLKDTTGTTVTHTGAVAGTKYYYKVRAIHSNSAANGEYCSPKYVTAR